MLGLQLNKQETAMGKKRECGSETGVKRETSRFLPDYDVTDKTWYNGYNAGVRESD